jgi:hypothetical protein
MDIAYLIFLCAGVHLSYLYGKQTGIERTVDYLEAEGVIEFDEEK